MICNGFINNCKETVTVIVQEDTNNLWLTIIGCTVLAKLLLHYLNRKDSNRVTPASEVMKVAIEERYDVPLTKPSHSELLTHHPTIKTKQSPPVPLRAKPITHHPIIETKQSLPRHKTVPLRPKPITHHPIIETRQSPAWHKTVPLRSTNADGWGGGQSDRKLSPKFRYPPMSRSDSIHNKDFVVLEREGSNNPLLTFIGCMVFGVSGIFFLHHINKQEGDLDRLTPSRMMKVTRVEERYDPTLTNPSTTSGLLVIE
jgi:hypothetical protein